MADYIDFDEFGITEIRCMQCYKPIATREEVYKQHPSNNRIQTVSYKLRRWSTFRQTRIELSDNTYAEPFVCEDCLNIAVLDEDKFVDEIKKGWKKELIHAKRSAKEIEKHEKRVKDLKPKKSKDKDGGK